MDSVSFYQEVGGEKTFARLVDRFYAGVATDPLLRPLYPDEDLTAAKRRLRLFLQQYWGGPDTYSRERGHPRLRLRHAPYEIGTAQRDAWLTHMAAAVAELNLTEAQRSTLWDYLSRAATFMINTAGTTNITDMTSTTGRIDIADVTNTAEGS